MKQSNDIDDEKKQSHHVNDAVEFNYDLDPFADDVDDSKQNWIASAVGDTKQNMEKVLYDAKLSDFGIILPS